MVSVLNIKKDKLLEESQFILEKFIKNDGKVGTFDHSKYSKKYWNDQTNELINIDKKMNFINFCQIVSENMLNLYLEKIRKINDDDDFVAQREYLLRSGFVEDLLRY